MKRISVSAKPFRTQNGIKLGYLRLQNSICF